MRRSPFIVASLLVLGGCGHNFVPPPGHLGMNVTQDAATCRLKIQGLQKDVAFGASGSPKFVGITMGAMAITTGLIGLAQNAQNFDDCMLAEGYLVDDGHATVHPPMLAATSSSPVVAQSLPPPYGAPTVLAPGYAPPLPPPPVATPVTSTVEDPSTYVPGAPYQRRSFGALAVNVSVEMGQSMNITPLRGIYVLDVDHTGAGWTAGLRQGDVILAVGGMPINSISDMATVLNAQRPFTTVTATIRRIDHQTNTFSEGPISIQF